MKLSGERNLAKPKAACEEDLSVSASFDTAESGSIGGSLDNVARKEIARRLREERASPDFIYAFEKTGNLVTDENRDLWTAKARRAWDRALVAYRRTVEGDSKAIDLCFTLRHETGRTDSANKKHFAASESDRRALRARSGAQFLRRRRTFLGGLVGLPLAIQAGSGDCPRSYGPSALYQD